MERITTSEAARRLGISSTQVRRRIAAGTLQAEAEQRPQGSRLVVLWDAPPDAPAHATRGDGDATYDATLDATVRTALEEEVRWLRERLERAEEERAELRRMLNLEQQTVAALKQLALPPRSMHTPEHAPEVATGDATGTPHDGSEVLSPDTLERTLKDAGITGKKRRRLLDRLVGLVRRPSRP